tara:strand:- start:1899 stop:2708 length:810 start_codon:yes stop_codon:yes gene_type:complete
MKTKNKIFLAKILSKLLTVFISKKQVVIRNKIKWNLDLNEGIDLSVYLFGSSERKIINVKKLLSKKLESLTILDIGANIGSISLPLATMFKNSKIFAIEPTNYAYNKLSDNLALNEQLKKNVFLRQLFITNNKKPQKVWSSWNFETSNNKHQKHLGTLKDIKENAYLELDQFIENEKLENVDLIKLDVDGYELDVLSSGEDFLKNNKPVIFMEIAPYLYPEFGYSCQDLIKFITNLNYSFLDENLKNVPNILDHVSKIKDGSSKNFFLI